MMNPVESPGMNGFNFGGDGAILNQWKIALLQIILVNIVLEVRFITNFGFWLAHLAERQNVPVKFLPIGHYSYL
jgi:hypothetical protein